MSNQHVFLVVEGYTEQTFIREVLAPYMATKSVFLYPMLIGKPGHKGGDIRFERAKEDIGNLLKQRKNTYVTTMFDYFRIEQEWPGREEIRRLANTGASLSTARKATVLENATQDRISAEFSQFDSSLRFFCYIEMHEFEALLFSDSHAIYSATGIDKAKLQRIVDEFDTPEDINDDPINAPSKRLIELKEDYRKVAMGKAISEFIGIEGIRSKCPHFNKWLERIENLKQLF
jgi:hypothetical protein